MSIVEMIRIETNRDFKTDKIGRNMENNENWREEAEEIIWDHLNKRIAYYDISMVDKFDAILQHYLEAVTQRQKLTTQICDELLCQLSVSRNNFGAARCPLCDRNIKHTKECLLGKYEANQ